MFLSEEAVRNFCIVVVVVLCGIGYGLGKLLELLF